MTPACAEGEFHACRCTERIAVEEADKRYSLRSAFGNVVCLSLKFIAIAGVDRISDRGAAIRCTSVVFIRIIWRRCGVNAGIVHIVGCNGWTCTCAGAVCSPTRTRSPPLDVTGIHCRTSLYPIRNISRINVRIKIAGRVKGGFCAGITSAQQITGKPRHNLCSTKTWRDHILVPRCLRSGTILRIKIDQSRIALGSINVYRIVCNGSVRRAKAPTEANSDNKRLP